MDVHAVPEPPPGYVLRPYACPADHAAMAAVRLGCAERDGIDAGSVVEGLPKAAEIAESCAESAEPPLLVEDGDGGVVG